MRPLDRIRKLEARQPAEAAPSPWGELAPFLTIGEMERILGAGEHERPLPAGELERLAARAHERRVAAIGPDDAGERETRSRFWAFTYALGHRHEHGNVPSYLRFDLLDLASDDVHELVRLAASATGMDEPESSSQIIARLWLDGAPMTVAQFAHLVLRGECSVASTGERPH